MSDVKEKAVTCCRGVLVLTVHSRTVSTDRYACYSCHLDVRSLLMLRYDKADIR